MTPSDPPPDAAVFDPGLASITVAETELSQVDGEEGQLLVRGYPIEELAANATYEEALFLLWEGRLPEDAELEAFREGLAGRRRIPPDVHAVVRRAAAEGESAMDAVRVGVAAAGLGEADAEDPTDPDVARRVVAVVPTIAAAYWRYRQGEDPVAPREDLGHAANLLYMLSGDDPDESAVRGMETFLTTMIDHGLNPSTFTARVVVSTESDLVSAATAAVGALKGPRHGGRVGPVFDVVLDARAAEDLASFVRERASAEAGLPGFGHRVYRTRDPRAAVLSVAAERLYESAGGDDVLATVRDLEAAAVDVLAEMLPERRPKATVEYYAAALLHGVDVPRDLFAAAFAASRVGGWMAHAREQRADNTLVRPTGRYVGERGRSWTPVEERRAGDTPGPVSPESLEDVSETLAALSEPGRLEILLALQAAGGPVTYSELRDRTTFEDKGRFNYHLRQLRGSFVADGEEGYELTDAGARLVDTVLTDDALRDA